MFKIEINKRVPIKVAGYSVSEIRANCAVVDDFLKRLLKHQQAS
jgi:hypothetical protein